MEFIAFIHPKEKFSTVYFLFSDRKGMCFWTVSLKVLPSHFHISLCQYQDGRICLRTFPNTPHSPVASAGSSSNVCPLGFV